MGQAQQQTSARCVFLLLERKHSEYAKVLGRLDEIPSSPVSHLDAIHRRPGLPSALGAAQHLWTTVYTSRLDSPGTL